MKRSALVLAAGLCACTNVGQERIAVPLFVAGSGLTSPVQAQGDIALHIETAELAFGPLYLCAGATAGELCETARLEWLKSQVIDLTSASPVAAGELTGTTGPVRSWMYDLGISAQLTSEEPYVLDAARSLGNTSLRVVGSAELAGELVPFQAELSIQQSAQTELGVPVVRKSVSDDFSHDVAPGETGLLVRFDAAAWLKHLDLRPYLQDASCKPAGPERVCAQNTEHSCTPDGTVSASRDCSALGLACIRDQGCTEQLSFEQGSEPYRALRNALLVGARPSFEWGFTQ